MNSDYKSGIVETDYSLPHATAQERTYLGRSESPESGLTPVKVSRFKVGTLFGGGDLFARVAIGAIALGLLWDTWAHWGDVQIDCGREVYVPAEIVRGKLLYRDLWYPYGPLTPYLQALLFRIFGVHLNTLYIFGFLLTLAGSLLLFAIGRRLMAVGPAFIVTLLFMVQGFEPGIFNYIFPYSYAATLGMVFGFAALYFLVREALDERGPNMLCAGTAAGLALLTKPEFGSASYLALAAVVLMRSLAAGSLSRLWDALLALIPGLLINVAVYGWFFWRLSAAFILKHNFPSYFMLTYGRRFLAINGFRFAVWEIVGLTIGAGFSFLAWYMVAAAANSKVGLRSLLVLVYLALALLLLPHWLWIHQMIFEACSSIVFPRGMYWFGIFALGAAIVGLLRGDSRKIAVGVVAVYALATGLRVFAQVVPGGYAIFYDGALFSVFIMLVTGCDRDLSRDLPAPRRFRATTVLLFIEGAWICGIVLFIVRFAASTSHVPLVTPIGTIYTTRAAA